MDSLTLLTGGPGLPAARRSRKGHCASGAHACRLCGGLEKGSPGPFLSEILFVGAIGLVIRLGTFQRHLWLFFFAASFSISSSLFRYPASWPAFTPSPALSCLHLLTCLDANYLDIMGWLRARVLVLVGISTVQYAVEARACSGQCRLSRRHRPCKLAVSHQLQSFGHTEPHGALKPHL